MTNRSIGTGLVAVLLLLPAVPTWAQQAKCLAGKTGCMAKKATGLLKCEALAETPGEPADPNAKDCVTKVQTRFDGGLEPAKGCFEKLERKVPNDCPTVDDTGAAETAVDTCVAALVAVIDPPPPDQTKCGAGKKKCASKYLAALLKCRKLAQTPGKPTDPNTNGCVDKAVAKYTGGDEPAKGCFAKLQARVPNDCQNTMDSPTVKALAEDCVDDLVAVVMATTTSTTSTTTTTTTTSSTTSTTTSTTTTTLACDPVDCEDGLRCTDDTCEPSTGVCNHVFDVTNCGTHPSCADPSCAAGHDCELVLHDDRCPPPPLGTTCLAPQCTAAGCVFRDLCNASNPQCSGCAECSCNIALNRCVQSCPS